MTSQILILLKSVLERAFYWSNQLNYKIKLVFISATVYK